jgi:transposase
MFVIGIDPHSGSHAAAALDEREHVRAVLHLAADRQQRQRLLLWAEPFAPPVWAVEGATGTGALLAQQLVAVGETVLDVPPKLAARVRLLDNNHSDKTDTHDARSTAIVALRNTRLRQVGLEPCHIAHGPFGCSRSSRVSRGGETWLIGRSSLNSNGP